MTVSIRPLRPALRQRLLLGVSAPALIVTASAVDGQRMCRKSRGATPAEQAAAAAAQRATQSQAASTATRRTIEAFQRPSMVRQRMDAAQVAARRGDGGASQVNTRNLFAPADTALNTQRNVAVPAGTRGRDRGDWQACKDG